jgi:ribosome-associated heat shock protein Hsp15
MSATGFANTTQRIDKWLWFARLVKTRSLAQRLVADGHVRVNRTRLTKASQTVSAGDVISMLVHDRVRVVQVVGSAIAGGRHRKPAPSISISRNRKCRSCTAGRRACLTQKP